MKHLWFRRKTYGYGWFPLTWQGWAIIAGYILGILLLAFRVQPSWTGEQLVWQLFVPVGILFISLITICIKTGEKPRWQWGNRDRD